MHTTGCLGVSPETCSFFCLFSSRQTNIFFPAARLYHLSLDRCSATRFTLHHIGLLVPELFVYSPDKPSGGVSTVFVLYRILSRRMFNLHQGLPHRGVSAGDID